MEKKNTPKKDYVMTVGRRKEASARVRIYNLDTVTWGGMELKRGDIAVNNKYIEYYFSGDISKAQYLEPLRTTNTFGKYIITVSVKGGGPHGQLEATIHGISRSLNKLDVEKHRPILKKKGYLTRDARVRERRKVGTGGKARRQKQSPKR